jgi:hypothetical protein
MLQARKANALKLIVNVKHGKSRKASETCYCGIDSTDSTRNGASAKVHRDDKHTTHRRQPCL